MTTLYILATPETKVQALVSMEDVKIVDATIKIVIVESESDVFAQLKTAASLPFIAGDILCLPGLCPRASIANISNLAKESGKNYVPGKGVDHRGVDIQPGKINFRKTIEANGYNVWPYIMAIGNPEDAKLSFELVEHMDATMYWPNYTPETIRIEHLLAVACLYNWESPNWFKVVDLSVRDLEIAPVMYSSHMWHDWIAFYPANGNFKLENHAQLHPVWLAGSTKPMEYWKL